MFILALRFFYAFFLDIFATMYTTKCIQYAIKDISEQDRIVQFYICK